MFSKSKINEPGPKAADGATTKPTNASSTSMSDRTAAPAASTTSKAKPSPSALSADLTIVGNIRTTGDIQVEGHVQGDIRAHLLTVGESATVEGEIVADDIIVTGRVVGRVRGLKVRLTSTAKVEGDIIHKTIAIESGAHFEGSVQRQEDPLAGSGTKAAVTSPTAPKPTPAPRPASDGPES
ncbi:MAG: polymer-forming cytoskeletal protein [Pseudomonadota bacterium]